jgi:type I restriction enzyme S subunit
MREVKIHEAAWVNPRTEIPIGFSDTTAVAFLPMSSVSEDGQLLNVVTRPLAEVFKGYTAFERNDVIIAKITPCMENGKAAVVDAIPTPIGFGSTEFHVMRPKPGISSRYLFHAVWNSKFRNKAAQNMTGSAGQKRVPKSFLENFEIPLPPLAEQERIAGILDKADGVRRKREEALKLSDELLRSVFLDMFGDPVTNPKRWEKGTIRDLVASVNYGTSTKADAETGKYPVLRMNNITYSGGWDFESLKYCDIEDKDLTKFIVSKGQMLFNRTNSKELVGKTAVYRRDDAMAFAGYLVRANMKPNADAEYVSAYLNSYHGKATLRGMCKSIVGMANINAQEMLGIPILLPPATTQKAFGDIVRRVDARRSVVMEAHVVTKTLFSSLQQRAFSGQL